MTDAPAEGAQLRSLLRFNQALDLAGLLRYILETALGLARAGAGTVLLEEDGRAVSAASLGLDREYEARLTAALEGNHSVKGAAPRVLPLLPRRKEPARPGAEPPRDPAAFPLTSGDRFLGALCVGDGRGPVLDRAERDRLLTFCDLAAVALENFRLVRSAVHDAETSVLAAGYFATRLEEEFSRAQRYRRRLTLVLVEVDRLALIRDLSGAPAALRVLTTLVGMLRKTLRRVDIIGRTHEGVFALLLPETPANPAAQIARRLAEQVAAHPFQDGGRRFEVGIVAGVVSFPGDGVDAKGLLRRAEEVLEAARRTAPGTIFTARDLPAAGERTADTDESGIDHLVLSREGRALLGMITRMANRREVELEALLDHVAAALVEMTKADRGLVVLVGETGEPEPATLRRAAASQEKGGAEFPYDEEALLRAVRERRTQVLPAPGAERRAHRAVLAAPMLQDERVVGAVYVEAGGSRRFGPEEIDFLESSVAYLGGILRNAWEFTRQRRELLEVREVLATSLQQLETKYSYANIIGKSKPMQRLYSLLDRVVETHHPVLIQGESGTGKELVARAIHYNGPRKDKPFIAENCAALPGTLLEAELFGYVKGAFTGAVANKKGLLEIANGGTLFLDEVGEMSSSLQKKLLRVLENKEFRPLGGKETVRTVDVRFISATNQDLKKMIEKEQFREDLFYRLNVVNIVLPPLRERKEDVPPLVEHFLAVVARETGVAKKEIAKEGMRLVLAYDWPGNVRELENTLKNVCVFTDGPILTEASFAHLEKFQGWLAPAGGAVAGGGWGSGGPAPNSYEGFQLELAERERSFLRSALAAADGNKLKVARTLGITRPALYRALKRLGLE
ncbi:MAG: sigma 54-interacting transcriptional regulator [Planctomycetes bacterium]|nr:sigma 54-interacting transcriptional regulator [Planctomycetota bacterium]